MIIVASRKRRSGLGFRFWSFDIQVIGWPVLYSKEASEVGIRWPRGVLLHGPPGVGKTAAVLAVAKEFNASVHLITAGRIMGSYMGESERNLREKFRIAYEEAEASPNVPVVIFLDDVDTLCPQRTHGQHHEARVVGQLLTLLDGADSVRRTPKPTIRQCKDSLNDTDYDINATSCMKGAKLNIGSTSSLTGHVMVIAATSRPNALDPALRRPGRIDKEIAVPMPDVNGRESILRLYIENRLGPMGYRVEDELNEEREVVSIGQLASESDPPENLGDKLNDNKKIKRFSVIRKIAERCHGYTGADLWSLCREAALEATIGSQDTGKPSNDQVEGPYVITESNFLESMDHVGPSIARSVVSAYQPAYYKDLGGLDEIKLKMQQAIEWPITKAAAFKRFGINVPKGVLLHGPPGCAKTTLARAAITASGATFIPLQGASLYSMYVGEGEAELREAFRRGRLAKPSIIFIDEIDMVVGDRDSHSDDANSSSVRLLSTFLTEMDGMEQEGGVTVVATTNRPDAIDSALIRYIATENVSFERFTPANGFGYGMY